MLQSHVPREGTDHTGDRARQRCRRNGDSVEVHYDYYTVRILAWAPCQRDSGIELAVVLARDAESSGCEGNG